MYHIYALNKDPEIREDLPESVLDLVSKGLVKIRDGRPYKGFAETGSVYLNIDEIIILNKKNFKIVSIKYNTNTRETEQRCFPGEIYYKEVYANSDSIRFVLLSIISSGKNKGKCKPNIEVNRKYIWSNDSDFSSILLNINCQILYDEAIKKINNINLQESMYWKDIEKERLRNIISIIENPEPIKENKKLQKASWQKVSNGNICSSTYGASYRSSTLPTYYTNSNGVRCMGHHWGDDPDDFNIPHYD
jgi:hypothetical protein